ncbi:MAG: hypothetical protein KatS3mg121_0753 [Gammaproteobacteria bacterium]|nr:MAG: hypothetical protein KatS3mg121_0753 [Gammaproteobacteria bacterium]
MARARSARVRLPATLKIGEVRAFKEELTKRLDRERITLDGAAVERIDGAGLQLLAAFLRAVDARGGRAEWRRPSAALREAAARCGLADALKLDTES